MQGVFGVVTILVIIGLVVFGVVFTIREDRKLRKAEVKQGRGYTETTWTPPSIPSTPNTTPFLTPRNSQTVLGNQIVSGTLPLTPPKVSIFPTQETKEYILGWRVHFSLTGAWGIPWPTGYMEAACANRPVYGTPPMCGDFTCRICNPRAADPGLHPSPSLGCACGVYSTFQPEFAPQAMNVLVANSGLIIQHSRGYRAEKTQVIAYTINKPNPGQNLSLVDEAWSNYGITKCRSVEKLKRVFDYYTRNPDDLYDEVERLTLERQYHQPAHPVVPPYTEEMPF